MTQLPRISAAAFIFLTGSLTLSTAYAADGQAPTLDDVAFQISLEDAARQSPANVYDGLFPLSDTNPKLKWRDPITKEQIKVVSVMSQSAFDKYYKGVTDGVTSGIYSWVTLAPQMQEFCKDTGLSGAALEKRIKQRLGLVPGNSYAMFVEFWVNREDLFRPCPDPDPSDTKCDISFPQADGMPINPKVKGVDDYIGWFNQTYLSSYSPGGAPWTRLGYTYDWSPDTPKYGASEYLMTKGAHWEVVDSATLDEYCAP